MRTMSTAAVSPAQSLLFVKGVIDDTRSNGFHLNGGAGVGSIWVYTTSSTHTGYGALSPKVGLYAVAVAAGSFATSLTAVYAALYPSAPAPSTISGELTSSQPYGYAIRLSSGAYVPLALSSATAVSGGLSLWQPVSASVIGTAANGYAALSVTSGAAPAGTPSPTPQSTASQSSVPKHLLTAEYLLGLYGTRSVTPAQAAPYLSWAQTTTGDSMTIHNAGIKTQVYIDPNWLAPSDPLYPNSDESNFSHTCGGSRVTIAFGSASVRYDTNPASSTNQAHFAAWALSQKSAGHIDMIFEDNPGPLSPYAKYPSGMPCSYSASSWISGTIALDNSIPIPVMVNGLNAFTTTEAPNLAVVQQGANTAGGDLEGCYNDLNKPVETGNSWNIMEDSELATIRAGKLFECMGRDQGAAASNYTGRIFALASFLLTYDPNHAMIASEWATPSGFRVMPETGLVPLSPRVAEPSSVSSLKAASGAYGREYAQCYYRGVLVGACAVAITHDYGKSEPFPFSGYTHTLTLSGAGVLDGGTISRAGPPPPAIMQPYTAVVAFK